MTMACRRRYILASSAGSGGRSALHLARFQATTVFAMAVVYASRPTANPLKRSRTLDDVFAPHYKLQRTSLLDHVASRPASASTNSSPTRCDHPPRTNSIGLLDFCASNPTRTPTGATLIRTSESMPNLPRPLNPSNTSNIPPPAPLKARSKSPKKDEPIIVNNHIINPLPVGSPRRKLRPKTIVLEATPNLCRPISPLVPGDMRENQHVLETREPAPAARSRMKLERTDRFRRAALLRRFGPEKKQKCKNRHVSAKIPHTLQILTFE